MSFKIEREEFINKTFRIPKKTLESMSEICQEKNISLNKLVISCIDYALENMED